jgi:hypothetical protein
MTGCAQLGIVSEEQIRIRATEEENRSDAKTSCYDLGPTQLRKVDAAEPGDEGTLGRSGRRDVTFGVTEVGFL